MGDLIGFQAFKEKRRQQEAVQTYFGHDRDEECFREYFDSFTFEEKELLRGPDEHPSHPADSITFDFVNDQIIFEGALVPVQGDIDFAMLSAYTMQSVDEVKKDKVLKQALAVHDAQFPTNSGE